MRLIDADVMKKNLLDAIGDENGFYADITRELLSAFVDEQPTIEPKTVVEDYCISRNLMVVGAECFRLFTEPKPERSKE